MVIANLKDIKENQTKSTSSILNEILEQPEAKKDPGYVEKKVFWTGAKTGYS
ncbi:hypothetical protein [Salegentibacter sediminis]|uniref:hypothetical protein n=1 Tax=Salegentibacter sediminis TaxID=1930251 RepID=UPI0018E3F7A9|nr:hypothetical protein [Salegentibacter sediminis]